MSMNLSLDDIIKRSKSKKIGNTRTWRGEQKPIKGILKQPKSKQRSGIKSNSPRTMAFGRGQKKWSNGNNKFAFSKNRPVISSAPGPNIRTKSNIPDARIRIIQNIKKSIDSVPIIGVVENGKPIDARMKIEAQRQKKEKNTDIFPLIQASVTTTVHDGILQRSVGTKIKDRNYVVMEYDDEDEDEEGDDEMDIDEDMPNYDSTEESGPMKFGNLRQLRRTITNEVARRNMSRSATNKNGTPRFRSPAKKINDNRQYADVTRTIENNKPARSRPANPSPRRSLDAHRKFERARSPVNRPSRKTSSEEEGYRVLISNLHSNVTSEDIKELFEDVGTLLTARVVRSGTAEAIYKYQKDALTAVDVYDNRQLDGLPMKCMFIKPTRNIMDHFGSSSSSSRHGRNNIQSRTTSVSIQPDPAAIRKALFDD